MLRVEASGIAVDFAGLIGGATAQQPQQEGCGGAAIAGSTAGAVKLARPVSGKAEGATLVARTARSFLNHAIVAAIVPGHVAVGVGHTGHPGMVGRIGIAARAATHSVGEYARNPGKGLLRHLADEA